MSAPSNEVQVSSRVSPNAYLPHPGIEIRQAPGGAPDIGHEDLAKGVVIRAFEGEAPPVSGRADDGAVP